MSRFLSFALLVLLSFRLGAQTELPTPRNILKTYEKGTRSLDGRPGPKYWQNTANYTINIRFEPGARLIKGDEEVTYVNNSPDTIREIVFKIYPNIYQKGAQRLMSLDPDDVGDGVKISRMVVNGLERKERGWRINGTNMSLRLDKPLMPGENLVFNIEFSYTLNRESHLRTGQIDAGAWFVAYFFPRIAVYDDIDGWNRFPYLGTQEFYNDFCDFNLSVTVPRDYLVWATGDLTNCSDVLQPEYCHRLSKAEQSDAYTVVIDSADLKKGGITADKPENTFRFRAQKVTDVAFAVSNHYLWYASSLVVDPSSGRRTRVDAVFNPQHRDYFEVVHFARQTVEAMSDRFPRWPFPFSHVTVFDGLDQMEYPMMVNDNPLDDRSEAIELTDHEIFHMMFPFYMGTNETKYGWMDEGWATIGEWLISPMIDSSIVDEYGIARYEAAAGNEDDMPIVTLTTQEFGSSQFLNSYPKPALGYLYARDILGDERFFNGLHHYIRTWNGKHPMPNDFFYSMNTGSGVNLNWFWKRWFYEDGFPDLAIARVNAEGREKEIVIESKGAKPVPVDLTLTFTDGSEKKIHHSPAVWEKGGKSFSVKITTDKTLRYVRLGSTYVPDVDKRNNFWERK
ncbi:MAG TPA: M1 family metallopeptidase [Saprospiraceae bacterium]|nr:M1 family metallopeptidase [Saprospiraceae bacterium]